MSPDGLRVTVGQHSEAGRHPLNQDFHGAVLPQGALLASKGVAIALADGIGSSAVSQIASATAVRAFLDDYYDTSEAWGVRRATRCVLEAVNAWLHAQSQAGEGRFDKDRGHVCTFCALVLKGREAHLLHVGDTRVMRLHPQALEPLTEDHRVAVPGGGHWLGRALGVAPTLEIDHRQWTLETGEVYLLACDGVWEHVDAAAVHAALAAHPGDLDAAARALVRHAFEQGSPDNLTAQLVRIDALPDPRADALAVERAGLALSPPLQARERFEGYRIVRELHASARSHVYLAQDEADGRTVVLKLPAQSLGEDAEALDRFLLEEWVARRVDSPHVLKAAASGRPRRHLFTVMAHVEGRTLRQWMTDHPQPGLDAVRRIVTQIARGLQAFHRKEMLHQDLRPENILIDDAGTVTLIDFGAVHVAGLAESGAPAHADALRGSLQYSAPEYFSGEGGSVASELFALAVLTYEMLTGVLPYGLQVTRVRGPADLARLHYGSLRGLRRDLPPWVDEVLRQALQPRAARRQEAISAFVHELHHPSAAQRRVQHAPLIERDPVVFWRTLALGLAVLAAGLAARLVLR